MRRLKPLFPKRLSLVLSLVGLLIALIFSACSNLQAANAAPDEFRIGYQGGPSAELLTKGLGLAEAQFPEVRIKWIPLSSSRSVLRAMVDGKIDVGLAGSVAAATAIAQGLPVQVYFIHGIISDNEALAVTKASNIRFISDLAGKTIAVPFGSTTHFSMLSALANANIEASQVTLLDMQPAEILSAWKRGLLDGGFVWQPTLGKMLTENGKVLLTAGQLADSGVITADLGIVSQSFANRYPKFLTRYVGLLDEAVHQYRDDPEAAAEAIAPEINLSPSESLTVMNQVIWLDAAEQATPAYMGTPGAPGAIGQVLKASADFMVAQKAIPPAPDLTTFQAGLFNQAIEQTLQETSKQALESFHHNAPNSS